ncbi:glycosyltransferase family 2 protein [Patescibacteria group bacterium]|nr:glycosyltransferase family 2 protein [Patescibacteria group bacterium]
MKLAVAFLCYQNSSSPYLTEFLASLKKALEPLNTEILILAGDNSGSDDRSNEDYILAYNRQHAEQIRYFDFKTNLGFAKAYNFLINTARANKAEYFLMLNPDMLLDSEAIKKMLLALDGDSSLAAVCPKTYRWDFRNKQLTKIIDSCGLQLKPGLRFYDLGQGELDYGQYDRADIIGPSGAVGMFRLSDLEKISVRGEFYDERFFMYKEDCDLAYRLKLNHLSTRLLSSAFCYHDRSAAKQGNLWQTCLNWRKRSKSTRSWSFVNQHLLFLKYILLESYYSRFLIVLRVIFYAFFSLFLAQFLLKDYTRINRLINRLD